MKKFFNKKGVSVIEYVLLVIIVIGAFLVMRGYIQRGVNGHWESTGQSFGFGRQYDSQKSIDCAFDGQSGSWYDHNCYEYYINNYACNGDATCEEGVMTGICSAGSQSSCQNLNNGESL